MKSFADRLVFALKTRGVTQIELSKLTGIPQSTLSTYMQGVRTSPSAENALLIAKALRVRLEWLITGQGEMTAEIAPASHTGNIANSKLPREFSLIRHTAPLIAWSQVQRWEKMSARDRNEAAVQDVFLQRSAGKNAFAVKFLGDSMSSPTDPRSIPSGSIVVIDPDVPPEHGAIVLATVGGETLLRLLWTEGSAHFLRVLGPTQDFPPIPLTGGKIHGVAVQLVMEKSLFRP